MDTAGPGDSQHTGESFVGEEHLLVIHPLRNAGAGEGVHQSALFCYSSTVGSERTGTGCKGLTAPA